jgi:hypothetical protein
MTSDRCGNSVARGKGGAIHRASLVGSVVAHTNGVATATVGG